MIEVENTDVNIVRNLTSMRNHMPASAYGLKAISDWFFNISGGTLGLFSGISLISVAEFLFWIYRSFLKYFKT